jgi:hypothetical protein
MRRSPEVSRITVIGVVSVMTLVMTATATASRSPTPGEEDEIKFAFREAHFRSERRRERALGPRRPGLDGR